MSTSKRWWHSIAYVYISNQRTSYCIFRQPFVDHYEAFGRWKSFPIYLKQLKKDIYTIHERLREIRKQKHCTTAIGIGNWNYSIGIVQWSKLCHRYSMNIGIILFCKQWPNSYLITSLFLSMLSIYHWKRIGTAEKTNKILSNWNIRRWLCRSAFVVVGCEFTVSTCKNADDVS